MCVALFLALIMARPVYVGQGIVAAATVPAEPRFQFDNLFIKIPADVQGYVKDDQPDEYQGLYQLRCWVNDGRRLRIAVSDDLPPIRLNEQFDNPVDVLRRLLAGYNAKDVDAVMGLYEPASRKTFQERLSDPSFKTRWLDYVSSFEWMEPWIVWVEQDKIYCWMAVGYRDKATGNVVRTVSAMIFTTDYRLLTGQMTSVMDGNLRLFVADKSRDPEHLIANAAYFNRRNQQDP